MDDHIEFEFFRKSMEHVKELIKLSDEQYSKSNNLAVMAMNHNHKSVLKDLEYGCESYGHGEYVDGVFVLKNADTHTD